MTFHSLNDLTNSSSLTDNHLVSTSAARLAQIPESSAGLETVRETEMHHNESDRVHNVGDGVQIISSAEADPPLQVGGGADDRSDAPLQ